MACITTMQRYEIKYLLDSRQKAELLQAIRESDGSDGVVIYIENPRSMKNLPPKQKRRG